MLLPARCQSYEEGTGSMGATCSTWRARYLDALRATVLVAVAAATMASCGGDDCTSPGTYDCTFNRTKTDCPSEYLGIRMWSATFMADKASCGIEEGWAKAPAPTGKLSGCTATCEGTVAHGAEPQVNGTCTVLCPKGSCSYDFVAYCFQKHL